MGVDRDHRYYKRIMKDLKSGMVVESDLYNFKVQHPFDKRGTRCRNTETERYKRLRLYLIEVYGCPKEMIGDIITSYEILYHKRREGWKYSKTSTHPSNFKITF